MKQMQGAGLVLVIGLVLTSGCSQWISKRALERGATAMKQNDYATAVKQFEKAALRIVDSPDLYYNLGKSYQQLNDLDKALKNYQTALNLKPSDTDCMMCIGEILLKRQQWDEATAIYEKVSLGLPPDASVLTSLAKAAHGAGRTDAARIYLIRAVRADANYAPARYDLACLYRDVFMLPAEAIEQFDCFMRLADPQEPHVAMAREKILQLKQVIGRQTLQLPAGAKRNAAAAVKLIIEGDRLRAAKQLPKAEKAYRDALAADPLSQDAAFNLALVCKAKNNLPEAMKLLLRAANMEPLRQTTLLEAAQTAIVLKDWPTASRMLDRVLASSPAFAPAYASMALVRQYQGQKAAARVYAEQFVRLAAPGPDRDRYEKWASTLPQ
ncbi:MAG: tetratricopeptide repeat protein [Kiritimatiellia bacterium]